MKTKRLIPLVLILLASLAVGVLSASAADDDLVGLAINNRTDRYVLVSLLPAEGPTVYFLAVPAGETRDFTVPRAVYTHTTVACGLTATGSFDISRFTTLVFTPCGRTPANPGELGIEKIHLFDSPDRKDFSYQME